MGVITGLTAARMLEIEDAGIVAAAVVGNNLILTKHDGSTINAGDVITPPAIPVVTSLPGSPTDGQEVYLQTSAMATKRIMWHLRYRAAGTTYKWEFLGGPPWQEEIYTEQSVICDSTWRDPATAGPSITVPLAGVYLVSYSANGMANGAAQTIATGVNVGTGWANPYSGGLGQARTYVAGGVQYENFSIAHMLMTVAANDVIRQKYWGNAGGGQYTSFSTRVLSIIPVALG